MCYYICMKEEKVLAKEILKLILLSAENAFIQVTVFIGAVLILFGYIDYKLSGWRCFISIDSNR